MKKVCILILGLLLSQISFADGPGPESSAFAKDGKLYVTILTDTCNIHTTSLNVNKLCDKNEINRDTSKSCNARLLIASTKKYCGRKTIPKVFEIDLNMSLVHEETNFLELEVGQDTIPVILK